MVERSVRTDRLRNLGGQCPFYVNSSFLCKTRRLHRQARPKNTNKAMQADAALYE